MGVGEMVTVGHAGVGDMLQYGVGGSQVWERWLVRCVSGRKVGTMISQVVYGCQAGVGDMVTIRCVGSR